MFSERGEVEFGPVTFVPLESILRELFGVRQHNPIALDLRDDTRRRH